jgi:regulatory protein
MSDFPKTIVEIKGRALSNHVLIVFNTGEFLRLSLDLVLKHQLLKGKALDEQSYNLIQKENELIKGKNYAHNYCSQRIRSEKEVRTALSRRGYDKVVINQIIIFLKEFNFLNDENFAKMALNYYRNKRNYGTSRIRLELQKKGINKNIIENILSNENISPEHELEQAHKIIEKKMRIINSKVGIKKMVYIMQLLNTRGFSVSTSRTIIDKFKENEEFND